MESDDGSDATAGNGGEAGDVAVDQIGGHAGERGGEGPEEGGAATVGGRMGFGGTQPGGAPASGDRVGAGGATTGGIAEAGSPSEGGQVNAGGAGGAAEAGATPVGGNAGAGALLDEIVLHPDTMIFYETENELLEKAVIGYDAEARACAGLSWIALHNELILGATCSGVLDQTMKRAVVLPHDGPCTREEMDQLSWVDAQSIEGCIDGGQLSGITLVDAVAEVESEAFTGRIIADNRSSRTPSPVTFGLIYATDVPARVYVQSNGRNGYLSWVNLTRGGLPVQMLDTCYTNCDGSDSECGNDVGLVETILWNDYFGSGHVTWDGYLYEHDEALGCETRTPAPDGLYEVEMCFGYTYDPIDSGDWVMDPTCVTQEFTLPTELVTIEVDYGG